MVEAAPRKFGKTSNHGASRIAVNAGGFVLSGSAHTPRSARNRNVAHWENLAKPSGLDFGGRGYAKSRVPIAVARGNGELVLQALQRRTVDQGLPDPQVVIDEDDDGTRGNVGKRGKDISVPPTCEDGECKFKSKTAARRFEAEICSFPGLMNTENTPTPLHEVLERLRPIAGGSNFAWERDVSWGSGYGGSVTLHFQTILWYHNSREEDVKTHVRSSVSFLHKRGCAYMFQPVVPLNTLIISPRASFRQMFETDQRSFHTFKLAWRHYLDFGASDYRVIVGDQLMQWTLRCKEVIEKPLNAVYWLMLMVASFYREELVKRGVLQGFETTFERVPVVCIDSFVALSALLFSPERQVLYAGVDPTPSYLQWLQYVADQNSHRKDSKMRKSTATVFERNELLDLPVLIVYYGRVQQKVKESAPLSWVGNPNLIKKQIVKYCQDNLCIFQLQQAIRLYTYSCSLGYNKSAAKAGVQAWLCWNGLRVCEIGVPMPTTQATFLSPFVATKPIAFLCPIHGPGAAPPVVEKKETKFSKGQSRSRRASASRRSSMKEGDYTEASSRTPSKDDSASRAGSDSDFGGSSSDEYDIFTDRESQEDSQRPDAEKPEDNRKCTCIRYVKVEEHKKTKKRHPGETVLDPEVALALQSLGDFDLMHCFATVLAGGLNQTKHIIRTHFSIDPQAYTHLPTPMCTNWLDGLLPWYCEFHRSDAHGRSRYGHLLESVLRGILGDGYTSGLHEEVLDIIRIGHEAGNELEQSSRDPVPTPFKTSDPPVTGIPPKEASGLSVSGALKGLRRASNVYHYHSPGAGSPTMAAVKEDGDDGERQFFEQSEPVSPVPPSLPGTHLPTQGTSSGKQTTGKGILGDLSVWIELYETESVFNYRSHIEHFSLWCHSAQLLPFLQRVYRRCGVAGLLPGQRCGGGSEIQADPNYPLVLPTIPNFCYGRGYPLHRVFEYFYGGVRTIVASMDDAGLVEAARAALPLIPGQERLNNTCWFQLTSEQYSIWKGLMPSNAKLDSQMLLLLEKATGGRVSMTKARGLGAQSVASGDSYKSHRSHRSHRSCRSVTRRRLGSQLRPDTAQSNGAHSPRSGRSSKFTLLRRSNSRAPGQLGKKMNKRMGKKSSEIVKPKKKKETPPPLGALTPEDQFFWFCSRNYALCTYPADCIPRHMLSDSYPLVYHYNDVISRTGTPEPAPEEKQAKRDSVFGDDADADDEMQSFGKMLNESSPGPTVVIPPSICLCQPTELTAKPRHRWEIPLDFVDDKGLILGDSGWFPGALGQRFSYEAKSDNVTRFTRLSEVPQAQLLYLEHTKISQAMLDESAKLRQNTNSSKDFFRSDSQSSSDESNSTQLVRCGPEIRTQSRQVRATMRRRSQKNILARFDERGVALKLFADEDHGNADLMLPPLMSANRASLMR